MDEGFDFEGFAAMADFEERKRKAMAALESEQSDRSRKGGLDAPIATLVSRVNAHPHFFTTSSCSGRITLFSEPSQHPDAECMAGKGNQAEVKRKKKGGDWLLVSHEPVNPTDVVAAVHRFVDDARDELLVFRFEPFILALDCSTVSAAQELVASAIASGFRESGITSIKKRIMVAVRCSIRLEVPVVERGELLVSEDYLNFLSSLANRKLKQNKQRTDRFLESFVAQFQGGAWPSLDSLIEVTNHDHFGVKLEESQSSAQGFHDICKSGSSNSTSDLGDHAHIVVEKLPESSERSQGTEMEITFQLEEMQGSSHNEHGIVYSERNGLRPAQPTVEDHFQVVNDCSRSTSGFFEDSEGGFTLQPSELVVSGSPPELLLRWGHSTCTMEAGLLIFGGYGGIGRHGRLNDILILTLRNQLLSTLKQSTAVASRMAQTASYVNGKVWIIGGRKGPHTLLDEILVIDLESEDVHLPKLSGAVFPARHRHAAAVVNDKIYVFGGLGAEGVLGDLYVLDTTSMTWSQLECKGDIPSALYSHSLCAIDQKLYLFGGYDGKTIYGDLHILDTLNLTWTKAATAGDIPGPRYSHSCTVVGDYLAILGGCPTIKQVNSIFFLDTVHLVWKKMTISLPSNFLLVRHTANLVGHLLVVIGGGASCFAFGTMFSSSFVVDMDKCLHELATWSREENSITYGQSRIECSKTQEDTVQFDAQEWALQLDRAVAKTGKDMLKSLGWLDSRRKPRVTSKGAEVAFPVTQQAANELLVLLESNRQTCVPGSNLDQASRAHEELVRCGGKLVALELSTSSRCNVNPQMKIQKEISLLLQQKGLPLSLTQELPRRWERIGDLGILPANSLTSDTWCSLGTSVWKIIANGLDVCRLARQGPIAPTGTRDSALEMLLGEDGWVEHRENGILYCFDATKCMFSSGNVSERSRMGQLNLEGEVVVDLFAGIGYFVLPFLLRAHATKVYACEWNLHALSALRWNLRVNAVEDRCTVIEGDNRTAAPQGIANRVCLGLLPTSEGSWAVAVKALRPEGGILHVHENVKDAEEQQWIDYLIHSIQTLATSEGRHWDISVLHIEHVKWYAPHIRHIVVDVNCCGRRAEL